mgnify:FL=1
MSLNLSSTLNSTWLAQTKSNFDFDRKWFDSYVAFVRKKLLKSSLLSNLGFEQLQMGRMWRGWEGSNKKRVYVIIYTLKQSEQQILGGI